MKFIARNTNNIADVFDKNYDLLKNNLEYYNAFINFAKHKNASVGFKLKF